FDRLTQDGYILKKEEELNAINEHMYDLENDLNLSALQKDLEQLKTTSKIVIDDFKALMKQHKLQRQNKRNKLKNGFSREEQQQSEAELIKQSLYDKHLLRTLTSDFL